MPLEWFDDITFESRGGEEWVQYGPSNGQPFTIGFSRFYTYPEAAELLDWEWLPVDVLSYDSKKDAYLVEWHSNRQRKKVKRLNLLFEGENRDSFYKRIEKALKRRYFSESMHQSQSNWKIIGRSKYRTKIEQNIDDTKVGPLPDALKFGVLSKIGKVSNKQLSILVWRISDLFLQDKCYQEMNMDYVFSMKQAIYETNDANHILVEEDSSPSSLKFAQRALAISGAEAEDDHGELLHQVSVGARDLASSLFKANARFQKTTILVLGAMSSVLSDENSFFKRSIQFPAEFPVYYSKASLANEVIATILSVRWTQSVARILTENLDNLLDFEERNLKSFKQSRTHNFLKLISLIMSTQLRTIATKGIMNFLNLFNIRVFPIEFKGHEQYKPGAISAEQAYKVVPPTVGLVPILFSMPMVINDAGSLETVPPLDLFERDLEMLLTSPVELTKNINRMEVVLMTKLFTNPAEYKHISTLDIHSDFMHDARNTIFSIVRAGYPQIRNILKIYEEFAVLITETLDEEMYDDLNAEVIIFREPLIKYNSHLENIKHTTFDVVRIPPFVVDCTQV